MTCSSANCDTVAVSLAPTLPRPHTASHKQAQRHSFTHGHKADSRQALPLGDSSFTSHPSDFCLLCECSMCISDSFQQLQDPGIQEFTQGRTSDNGHPGTLECPHGSDREVSSSPSLPSSLLLPSPSLFLSRTWAVN